jgi:hypothetical protein
MKINLSKLNFNFEMEGLEIDVTAEEIRDLRCRVVNDSAGAIKSAINEAVNEAVDKIANTAPAPAKKAPAKKAAPKKAPVKKAVPGSVPW